MKNNQSLWSDGLTTEFYKFVNELKVLILKTIKHIFLPRQLSISKSSIIYRVGQKERSLDVS